MMFSLDYSVKLGDRKLHLPDLLFIALMISAIGCHAFYLSRITAPGWDGSVYLQNAKDWMTGNSLFEPYRPPLISWITGAIWSVAGENWELIKFVPLSFMVGSFVILYAFIKKHKGGFFALGVIALTAFNPTFFWNVDQIFTEQLALFFLALTLYFSYDRLGFLSGIFAGLTFASRYPVIIPAISMFIVPALMNRDLKQIIKTILGMAMTISVIISLVYLKTGDFSMGLEKDSNFTYLLNPFYIANSVSIWGWAVLLVPLAFLFRRTYHDKLTYTMLTILMVSLLFWSANSNPDEFQYRFTVPFTPVVYFFSILAVENIISLAKPKLITIEEYNDKWRF